MKKRLDFQPQSDIVVYIRLKGGDSHATPGSVFSPGTLGPVPSDPTPARTTFPLRELGDDESGLWKAGV